VIQRYLFFIIKKRCWYDYFFSFGGAGFFIAIHENFYPRYTKIFIAIKKLLHRDEKKHLFSALYATPAVFVKFFVKIFPQKLRNKKVFLTLPCKIKNYEYENKNIIFDAIIYGILSAVHSCPDSPV